MTAERREWARGNFNRNARPKAIEWHKSKEGRAWHSMHAKEVTKNMKKKKYICIQCNLAFYKKPLGENRFCTNACKSRYRRAMGFDDIERLCLNCNKPFTSNKYGKTYNCSKACGAKTGGKKNKVNKIHR